MARSDKTETVTSALVCPECGRSFGRAAAMGAHRRRAHGVVGQTANARRNRRANAKSPGNTSADTRANRAASGAQARSRRNSASSGPAVDRDLLLRTLFPDGIPARQALLRDVESWLDEAQRLAGGA